jgi:hypothetical protein
MAYDLKSARPNPKAFVSYSWDDDKHKDWVRDFATRLRGDGVHVTLDQWDLQPGDQLTAFMEASIRENDYVLIVCTPHYKDRSNQRIGGVGYEGDIMTAEVLTMGKHQKFIPIHRSGSPRAAAMPSWLLGKWCIDLTASPYQEDQYRDLLVTLHGTRPVAPPVVPRQVKPPGPLQSTAQRFTWEPIRILGLIVDQVSTPPNDGSRGSALYRIPFQLSRSPSRMWCERFVQAWDHPSSFTLMHRPGIARVDGDQIVLNGTTVEEVENTHRHTLLLAMDVANRQMAEVEAEMSKQEDENQRLQDEHSRKLREAAERLKF